MNNEWIEIFNAYQNNLKNVSIKIPKHQLTVFTGVSGSGKSTLVFDTLVAQSRRELNDTFSSYIQHILPKYGRPEVGNITNLPIAIPIEQRKMSGNVRSTVGTYTEIYTFLRLLFSRLGKPFVGYSDVFSFNHPQGKCEVCDGLGFTKEVNLHYLVDFNQSLNENPINFPTFGNGAWRWKRYADSGLFDLDKKIKDYSKEELDMFLYAPQQKLANPPQKWPKTALYEGILPRIKRSIINTDEGKRHKKQLEKFVTTKVCPACNGSRLNAKSLSCKIKGRNISDLVAMPLDELSNFIKCLKSSLVKDVNVQIIKRLDALITIGLGYLNLARSTDTLSGGEAQRIRIAKHITSSLNDVMYVLDEPSSGLHPKDIERIYNCLNILKRQGNTIILVEHNPLLIEKADYIIDVGPGPGNTGGQIQFSGTYNDFKNANTITSSALREKKIEKLNTPAFNSWFSIQHQSLNTLKNVSLKFPLNALTVLCGVAGSGKTSLAHIIGTKLEREDFEVINISQKNIGISLRSTPMTYLDIFDDIRKLFAKANAVSVSLFSYNSKGACPHCKGKGVIVNDMYFMDDVVSECELCHGTRYTAEVLQYKYHDKTIVDVLSMTVSQALNFFKEENKIKVGLQAICDVGLGYLKLNQSLKTLSGGELQRIKLSSFLQKEGSVYIIDEPTNGLHLRDIDHLLALFDKLIDKGNTIIIIEHSLKVIRRADWLIEMGPEGGKMGGSVMFSGTFNELKKSKDTITRPYL
ncbi:ATP-binding cassette domain-containing protein [Liquorilactobacillus mali]|uniref:UvrABC system protein A n=1 Tax=Liquorilactobacillus mali KCTC 3596 = DSM 20444 TaxID=1046596 RepID=J1F2U2_9LACO|nr:excinuclease ABC subunit UvrA [Liquorilactobacillus mali]EJE99371.1 excinuclease ATPase subunit [Liquorilactobacillus mali KCTC 3596 = DSM 20444]KRN09311.1 excinuclease ATPase subunit [Liquorilactobacillus mali KCTC 3596 = DSM 20444]MDC7952623.1 excinuclease ABC subunit UvrA [Liquorilactobacillus mali]QFQ74686.1 excinuclease ABC subunit UvrA [Liquorilactobacillus mali]